jgi:hypothetical protein
MVIARSRSFSSVLKVLVTDHSATSGRAHSEVLKIAHAERCVTRTSVEHASIIGAIGPPTMFVEHTPHGAQNDAIFRT